jgi:hypothetical protein
MFTAYFEGRLQTLQMEARNTEYTSLCTTSYIETLAEGEKSRRKRIKAVIWPEWSITAEHCCFYGNSNDGVATKYT